jgi:hypothetical protein
MRMITPTAVRPHHIDGSPHRFYAWANGNTASLVRFGAPGCRAGSYGAEDGLYEMATLTPDGAWVDVVGYLDETGVQRELERRQDEPAGMVYEY